MFRMSLNNSLTCWYFARFGLKNISSMKNKTHQKDDNTKPITNNTIFSLAAKPITSSTCLLPFAKPMKSSARLLPFAKPITSSKCSLLFAEPITSSANFSSVAG